MTSTPQALVHYHDFLVWMIARIEKFPRSQRHLLGARMESFVSKGTFPETALHEAVNSTREAFEIDAPVYWAPFVVVERE